MRTLLLSRDVALRPKSLERLREIGVKISPHEDGNRLEFPPGVVQVVSCVLETERPYLTAAGSRVVESALEILDGPTATCEKARSGFFAAPLHPATTPPRAHDSASRESRVRIDATN